MPAHKTNPLLKVAVVVVLVLVIIGLLATHHGHPMVTAKQSTAPQTSLDSAAEALNTLTTELAQTKQQVQAVVKANEALQHDNAQLQQHSSETVAPVTPQTSVMSQEPKTLSHGEPLTVIDDLTPADKPAEPANTEPVKAIPYYTIPANATSVHDRLMTALVGRIPVKGVVTDPYPFKLVVSDDTLAANGLRVPHLTQMIVSGYSEGDLNLLSVRGWVTSLTFVFDDGTITSTTSNDNNIGKFTKDNALGYLSDAYGNPFIRGQLITNAPAYLGGNVALGAAAGAANAYSQAQVSHQNGIAGSMNSSVTGSIGKYVEGQAMNNAANQVQQWWLDREQQSFDAIYVPTADEHGKTIEIVVNFSKEIPINYDPNGRKLAYDQSTLTEPDALA